MNSDLKFASDLRTVITRLIKKLRKESATGQQLSLTQRSTLALLLQHGGLLPSELAAMEKNNQSIHVSNTQLFAEARVDRPHQF